MRIKFEDIKAELTRILVKKGFDQETAEEGAQLFTENSCDGVYSHGINRFPRVLEYIDKGYIDVKAKAEKVHSFGAVEQWDGKLALGNVNAKRAMSRAIDLAKKFGIGCVLLKRTNHWMRGGAYGLQAAKAGLVGFCWTNTQPNMPAWGAIDCRIGNNPFVISLPYKNHEILMDMAVAQFAYGKMEVMKMAGKQLPVDGGYDKDGNLTKDPSAILESWRPIPIGFWKGSTFSVAIDMLASVLTQGSSVEEIGKLGGDEYDLSQVFIAIDLYKLNPKTEADKILESTIQYIKSSQKISNNSDVFYPGEIEYKLRLDNLVNGIPVEDEIWNNILKV